MVLRFDTGVEEVLAFQRHFLKTDGPTRRTIRRWRIVFPLLWLALVLFDTLAGEEPTDWLFFSFMVAVSVAWFAFTPALITAISTNRLRKFYRKPANSASFGPTEMTFTGKGIGIKRPDGISRIEWPAVERVDRTKEYFFIYTSSVTACIVPKKALTEAETEELQKLLAEHVRPSDRPSPGETTRQSK